ncbi:MAG: hypothetical protein M1365_11170 [Actinobacteria bacterium]|nr:hypothetical protein [Actinomycetota bacterium]
MSVLIKSLEDKEKILDKYFKENPDIKKWLDLYNISNEQILKNLNPNNEYIPISIYSSTE